MPPDEFDTIIQAVSGGWPHAPAASPPPRRALRFAGGTALWLLNANLLYLFVWFLLHG